uniref:Uncharacterized protein n=1 Tax=Schistosoma mansoni TaxID=6183 RepID=A0A3Q0KU37_SCHMA
MEICALVWSGLEALRACFEILNLLLAEVGKAILPGVRRSRFRSGNPDNGFLER